MDNAVMRPALIIHKAQEQDISGIAAIYDAILAEEEAGRRSVGWQRGVYPTEHTARAALRAGDLYVMEAEGRIVASCRINRHQEESYAGFQWQYPARDEEVMVLHTLTVAPWAEGRGHAKAFVRFYEDHAAQNGCPYLRMDTNARNTAARSMYRKLGYAERGIVPTTFNGITGVMLVGLEKRISDRPPDGAAP